MKQRSVEVMDVDRVAYNVEAQSVRLTVHVAPSDSAAGQPNREATIMVISSVIGTLHHGSAPKFTAPNDERVFEQTSLLQVSHQRRTGLIGIFEIPLDACREVPMLVPRLMKKLYEPDAALQ